MSSGYTFRMSADAVKPRGRTITTPDGRVFRGMLPSFLGHQGEGPYAAALAVQVGGLAEVVLPSGRADVATAELVFEVEPVRTWRHGARQAIAYAGMSGLRPCLALFGDTDYLSVFTHLRDCEPDLSLWRWSDSRWEHLDIESATSPCLSMPGPPPPNDDPSMGWRARGTKRLPIPGVVYVGAGRRYSAP